MKKAVSFLLACMVLFTLLTACGSKAGSGGASQAGNGTAQGGEPGANTELVDGKFPETRKITVEIYDRGNDGGSPPDNNVFTNFIKEGMLRDHNVEVEFVSVPRWTETEVINNLLAAGDAPDVCVTYSYPTIQTYANMGGVIDLTPVIEANKDNIKDLVDLITEENLYYDLDPETNKLWAIEARQFNLAGQKTFIREDWLKKLNIPEPTTLEEFEKAIYAFKENAELLLGPDADKIVPFYITHDVGWNLIDLADAMIPGDMTQKDLYVYGYDDRRLLYPDYKETVRLANKWYNDGLVWNDFALYGPGDSTGGNLLKSGFVGAYIQNYDEPYRNGDDGIQQSMQRLVGPEAAFITVATFKNDAGEYKKYWGAPVDRKIFFPSTNTEPVASLLYLNWISKLENRKFLQIGETGVNHEEEGGGVIKMLGATGPDIMNSLNNIDYTITCNGLNLGNQDVTTKSLALGYAGVDPSYIERAADMSKYSITFRRSVHVGEIKAEEGMATPLKEKRDNLLAQAVVAPVDKFDAVFDSGLQDYLNSGGQAIIDERKAAWEKYYGDQVD